MAELAEVIQMKHTNMTAHHQQGKWQSVCKLADIAPDSGICALLGEQHVAIFRLRKDDALFAVDNYDPLGQASVMSRGILGSIGKRLVVASPLYKQHFDLQTGECLEEEGVQLRTFPVRATRGQVEVFIAEND